MAGVLAIWHYEVLIVPLVVWNVVFHLSLSKLKAWAIAPSGEAEGKLQ